MYGCLLNILINPDPMSQLPYRVRWQDLKDLFRRAGTVLRADVSLGPDNRSRGYGNVVLATAEDAGRAIDMLNGYCWQTRILEVRPDRFGASVDEPPSLAIGGANGHLPPANNPYDETMFGHDLVGSGTGTKTLFVGNVSPLLTCHFSFTVPSLSLYKSWVVESWRFG